MNPYTVIFEVPVSPGGNWCAYVPDIPGCIGIGNTRDECRESVAESLRIVLEYHRENGLAIPPPTTQAEQLLAAA